MNTPLDSTHQAMIAGPDTRRPPYRIAVVSAGTSDPSSTRMLADRIGAGAVVLPVTPLVLVAGHATGLPPSTGPPVAV